MEKSFSQSGYSEYKTIPLKKIGMLEDSLEPAEQVYAYMSSDLIG